MAVALIVKFEMTVNRLLSKSILSSWRLSAVTFTSLLPLYHLISAAGLLFAIMHVSIKSWFSFTSILLFCFVIATPCDDASISMDDGGAVGRERTRIKLNILIVEDDFALWKDKCCVNISRKFEIRIVHSFASNLGAFNISIEINNIFKCTHIHVRTPSCKWKILSPPAIMFRL